MQILQWVSKGSNDNEIGRSSFSSLNDWKAIRGKRAEGKDIITLRHHGAAHERTNAIKGRNLKLFIFICGKDQIPKACFYRTLDLNKIRNLNIMKKSELSGGVGKNFILPITEESFSKTTESMNGTKVDDRKKPITRMKELLRSVAATKTDKRENLYGQKVLQSRSQGNVAGFPEDDRRSSKSPKITWSENVQTKNSHSHTCIPRRDRSGIICRKENWITTDSEFVVLEL